MKRYFVIAAVVGIAVGRLFITPRLTHIPTPELTYEACAHLLCGGLIAIHLYDRSQKLYGWMGWGIALWELACFVLQKSHLTN